MGSAHTAGNSTPSRLPAPTFATTRRKCSSPSPLPSSSPSITPSKVPAPTSSTTRRRSLPSSPLLLQIGISCTPTSELQSRRSSSNNATPSQPLRRQQSATLSQQFSTKTDTGIEKRDSLSPSLKQSQHHKRQPSTLSPISPSSSHPYTSKTHISPCCTVGSLTHRLLCGHLILTSEPELCGHLILTSEPELCARNCVPAPPPSACRDREIQSFVPNTRNLDTIFTCPACISKLLYGARIRGQDENEAAMREFEASLNVVSDVRWHVEREVLLHVFHNGSTQNTLSVVENLGRSCKTVEHGAEIGDIVALPFEQARRSRERGAV